MTSRKKNCISFNSTRVKVVPKLTPQVHAFIQDTRRYQRLLKPKVLVNQSNDLPIQINDGPSIVITLQHDKYLTSYNSKQQNSSIELQPIELE
jgi:hypothetical protein